MKRFLLRSLSTHSGPPIRVAFTPDAGRGVFATRNINESEIIHTAEPLITHPSLQNLSKACFFCLKRLAHRFPTKDVAWHDNGVHNHTLETSTCHYGLQPKFCSQKCSDSAKAFNTFEKNADWKYFHQFCSEGGLRLPLLAKRLVCMVLSGMVSRDALDILSYVNPDRDTASCWMHTRTMLLDALKGSGVPEDQLAYPNVDVSWPTNATARLIARRDIEQGEELRITYIDASMSQPSRQKLLKQAYHFECNCSRCKDED